VESVLKGTDGVVSADASFIRGQAVVTYDSGRTSPEALVAAINSQSFYRASLPGPGDARIAVKTRNVTLAFQRQFNPLRTWQIGTKLKKLPGVTDVNALEDGRVDIAFDPERVDPKQIIATVEELGFGVAQVEDSRWSWIFVYGSVSGLLVLSALIFVCRRLFPGRALDRLTRAKRRRQSSSLESREGQS